MKKLLFLLLFAVCLLPVYAQDSKPPIAAILAQDKGDKPAADKDKPRPIKDVLPDAKKIDGLFTFYQKKDKLYAEIKGSNLNTDYLIAMAVARGSGTTVIGGFTLDDWLWQFRKVNDTIQVVRRNIRFKADSGTPEAKAVDVAYSDSILYSLPIIASGDGGGDVIDLAPIFMTDLPKLGIGAFDRSRSTWEVVKGFTNNMEFRVAATYSGGSFRSMRMGGSNASPDPQSVGVTLHYSISRLPSSGYTPRIADPRIGYFATSHKNFSRAAEDDHTIRYINRWNLQKADPSANLSPPKKPIVFWVEKTVPFKYRNAVREGIAEWNKAFEKVGIINAIEVRQQADNDIWDAEDINYNTVRWITADAGFAMGPSRVNPLTGEILDADIIIDASWIDHWRTQFDYSIADILPSEPGKAGKDWEARYRAKRQHYSEENGDTEHKHDSVRCTCTYVQEKAAHFALASLALAAGDGDKEGKEEENAEEKKENGEKKEEGKDEEKKEDKKEKKPSRKEKEKEMNEKFEKLVQDGIKDVIMHEVGHTLGLRHNFEASSWLTLDEINDPGRSKEFGFAGSVMDYIPINIAPKGKPQGDYFMTTLGPYDYLAIEYGYKTISGGTDGEKRELAKIASRQAEKGYNYATDEDLMRGHDDPRTERYDLGKDPLAFSQRGLELYKQLLPEILDRAIRDNGSYRDVGRFYLLLIRQRARENNFLIRNLEGLYQNRDFKGDPGNRPPIQTVDAKTRRETVKFLCENTFGAAEFMIPPEVYNQFGKEMWYSDGSLSSVGVFPPIADIAASIQSGTLERLIAPWVLDALSDAMYRVPESEEVYTAEELFNTVTASVFSELETIKNGEFSARKPAIPALRRILQEDYFMMLSMYANGEMLLIFGDANSARSLARLELQRIQQKIDAFLKDKGKPKLDTTSSVHLTTLRDRIKKLLDANVLRQVP